MLEIRLLGQFEVKLDGQPIKVASRPARMLLAYLLLHAAKPHPREKLAGILWPESEETNARSNLRQSLWRLRKAIGDEYVLADNYTVSFDTSSPFWLDVSVLKSEIGTDPAPAVSAYQGELLPGYYEDWVLLERERLQAVFEQKTQLLLEKLDSQRNWPAVIKWAERWIAFGTIPEPAYRALMTAHAAQGDLAGMVAAYERCVAALQSEIGVEPSAETQTLYERLSKGIVPSGPSTLPIEGSETPAATPHNLPFQSTPFIGRKSELAQVRQLMSAARLVTVVGPGGMGKTRLALEAAEGMLDAFCNGVFLVRLASISSPELIVQTIAEAIGFPLATEEDPKWQLLRHLKTRQYLLLFDNFEHVLSGATLVSEILESTGEVKILVTSREKLNLQEESILRIEGLSVPDSPSVDDPLSFSALRLFHDSARRQKPDFVIRQDALTHIIQICRLMDGMPLGILLATAWVSLLTIEEIADEISRSFDFLQADWRNVPDRHRSLRAVFDSSWKRLTNSQRLLFARLTVFRGGFTREAAERVGGTSLPELVTLVNQSLLQRDDETGRYEIHELLGQFASAYIEAIPGEREAVNNAHATYYADFMDQRKAHMTDARNVGTLVAIEADIQNIRQAWRYWLERKDTAKIKMFADTLWRVYDILGWYNAGERLFREAVDALRPRLADGRDEDEEAVFAQLLGWLCMFKTYLGYSQQGLALAEESIAILKRLNRIAELAIPLDFLQYSAVYVADPKAAMQLESESIDAIIEHGDEWLAAYHLCWRGRAIAWTGEYERGRAQVEKSLRIFEARNDIYATVWPGLELGHLALERGDLTSAQAHYRRVLENAQKVKYDWALCKATKYLGNVAILSGDFPAARAYLKWGLRLADELGLIRDIVSLLYDIATVEAAYGSPEAAVKLFSVIRQHPHSHQTRTLSVFLGEELVRFYDLAGRRLDELKKELAASDYDDAVQGGRAADFDQVVVELLQAE